MVLMRPIIPDMLRGEIRPWSMVYVADGPMVISVGKVSLTRKEWILRLIWKRNGTSFYRCRLYAGLRTGGIYACRSDNFYIR